ncbi:exosome complex component CSL4 [Chrysoperla carnea]|uniref:exosome complex component CSL4 n=1 Tax=Chrysoperla carnea TaxID=189513 RepID=UPI001D08DA11|nr:exosome complex component CSL4 [Chrysoperla carnea]
METDEPLICLPGQRLSILDNKHVSGSGTYGRQGYIYSMLAGIVKVVEKDETEIIEVHCSNEQTLVPAPGDIVTAKVILINQRFCKCIIKCIGDVVLNRTYRGILRKEDVRANEKDKVDMYKSFRPGDIILARVMPITEVHTFHLTTAENELGVAIALSSNGVPMVPISWTEMQCPETLVKEFRKVAKVVPENINSLTQ